MGNTIAEKGSSKENGDVVHKVYVLRKNDARYGSALRDFYLRSVMGSISLRGKDSGDGRSKDQNGDYSNSVLRIPAVFWSDRRIPCLDSGAEVLQIRICGQCQNGL
jgi:hypothetical protein